MSKLPRSLKVQPLNRLRALNHFTRDADVLVERLTELFRIDDPRTRVSLISEHDRKILARCDQALDVLNPDDCYEKDAATAHWRLRDDVISLRIALLVGAFPTGAPGDPDVYVNALIEQVDAVEDLTFLALDAACHRIVGTMKFLPAPAEAIAVVNEENEKWLNRILAICHLGEWSRAGEPTIGNPERSTP